MCLPFNDSAVPRSDLHGGDESLFPYALAYHTLLMPLFLQALCECGEHLVYNLPPVVKVLRRTELRPSDGIASPLPKDMQMPLLR
jgi:hypothetical protein